jgi:DNA-binding response OmpR family regulator
MHYFLDEMSQHRILVVDDDSQIRRLLRDVFEGGGYDVREADSSAEAIRCLDSDSLDLITLDLQLGTEDGLDVARTIRKFSEVPIVMITGRDDVVDRVVGLELGADDYITKPFHVREVLARVRSVLRRAGTDNREAPAKVGDDRDVETATSPAFTFDGLIFVPERFELFGRDGDHCELTSGDIKLLNVFLQNAKRVLSRDRLMDLTGGVEWSPLDRTIDNQVARLRKKIERNPTDPKIIKTVRGVGYSFACEITLVQSYERPSSADSRLARSR